MKFNVSRKQAFYIKATLATLLFASASLQSVLSNKTNEEQISNRISDAIGGLVEQNEATVYDWARWDDTVELVNRKSSTPTPSIPRRIFTAELEKD